MKKRWSIPLTKLI